jgi:hypothetical protein
VPVIVSTIQSARAERYAAEALGALGVVGTAVDGFDARNPEVTPETFDTCGPHEDTLGWRYLGARSCVSKTSGGRVEVPFVSRRSGLHLVVIRARRDDGAPVRVPLRINGRVVSSLVLTARWDEWRLPLTFTAGDVRLSFELPTGVNAPRMSLDHVLSLPARR